MLRKSLNTKISECTKYGTFRTFKLKEAKDYYMSITELENAYNRGKYLCLFESFSEDIETVSQLNTLDNFIRFIHFYIEDTK